MFFINNKNKIKLMWINLKRPNGRKGGVRGGGGDVWFEKAKNHIPKMMINKYHLIFKN